MFSDSPSLFFTGWIKGVIGSQFPADWFTLITLGNQTGTHLWSIAVEIKYYFAIPVICLAFRIASKKLILKGAFLISLTTLCYYGCNYNLTRIGSEYNGSTRYTDGSLIVRITIFVFLSGTTVGLLIHSIQKSSQLNYLLKLNTTQIVLSVMSMYQFTRGLTYSIWPGTASNEEYMTYIHMPGFQWAIFMFLLLLSSSRWNPFVAFLENSVNLQKFGKYSFGIYLLHLIAIEDIKSNPHLKFVKDMTFMPMKLVILFVCIYNIGWLWYVLIEKNMIILASRLCRRLELKLAADVPALLADYKRTVPPISMSKENSQV